MMQRTPGDLIQYRTSGSVLPPWPALICTDDFAPTHVLVNRPQGYVTLVACFGASYQFQWARSSEMHDYDPSVPWEQVEMVSNTPGLGEAYSIANSGLESGLILQDWRDRITKETAEVVLSDEDWDSNSLDDLEEDIDYTDAEFDRYFEGILVRSRNDLKAGTPDSSASSSSHLNQAWVDHAQTNNRASKQASRNSNIAPLSSPSFGHNTLPRRPQAARLNARAGVDNTDIQAQKATLRKFFDSSPNRVTNSNRIDTMTEVYQEQSEGEESGDVREQFVKAYVGGDAKKYLFSKASVWNRQYFQNYRTGIMRFREDKSDGMFELDLPALRDIEPDDFVKVAEFLETEEFKLMHPRNEDELQTVRAQLITTYMTADKLDMTDLMDQVIDELERINDDDLWSLMALACHVYALPEPSLLPRRRLKLILTAKIAEVFWIYIRDEHLSAAFTQRMQAMPALQRDVFIKATDVLEERLRAEGHEEEVDIFFATAQAEGELN